MKKWVSLVMVFAILVGMTACKDTSDKAESSGTTTTTTTTTNPSSLSAYFTAVLEDKQTFVYDGGEVTLSHLLSDYKSDINRYTLVDMDGDGQAELIVEFAVSYDRLVIRKDGASYYGFLFPYRRMSDIYRDGSCLWSESAFLTGCARLHFDGNRYEWTDLWSEDLKDSDEDEDRYYVNGEPASKEEYDAVASVEKTEVEWIAWEDGK